ncbi:MAG: 3-keto-disaccharide hydrolase [Akkermansiaceae bacterium]
MKLAIFTFSALCSFLPASEWVSLFNGKDLTGWTAKIAGHPLGENAFETFRVEDGILKCEYDKYPQFDRKFGHLYSNLSYSHYLFRLEYKFAGKRMADAPGYVNLNSGIMIHSQPPQSMTLDQGFPVSLEFQFLADEGQGKRPTGNVCTPGTHLKMNGKLITKHIVQSSAPTFPADQWVKIEIEVRGNSEVIHRVEGKEVLRYQNPQIDPKGGVVATRGLLEAGAPLLLSHGHIALQAEGQPVWFRNIELKQLEATPAGK